MKRSAALPLAACLLSCGLLSNDPGEERRTRQEELLRGDHFPKLVLEVDAVEGLWPREGAQTALIRDLAAVVDKPSGVTAIRHDTLPARGPDHAWTFEELDALAKERFDLPVDADAAKLHVLFVDGRWHEDEGNSRVLGVAWAHTHLAIFKESLEDACRLGPGGLLSEGLCENAEHGVWLHEVGHLLGLVNNAIPMQRPHEDEGHPRHDKSEDCVMYWAWESGSLVDLLRDRLADGDDSKMRLCDACLEDLAAVREHRD